MARVGFSWNLYRPSVWSKWLWIGLLASLLLMPKPVQAAPVISFALVSSPDQPVGTLVAWNVTLGEGQPVENVVYQFSVRGSDGVWRMARDYRHLSLFAWTTLKEGTYTIRVTAKDLTTGETTTAELPYTFMPIVIGREPAVSATTHPLIALYSTRSCVFPNGGVRVRFRERGGLFWHKTPWMPCQLGRSMNFYVTGMRAGSNYAIREEVFTGLRIVPGKLLPFTTGKPPADFPTVQPIIPADRNSSLYEGVLLQTSGLSPQMHRAPFATDLIGRLVWYNPLLTVNPQPGAFLLRPLPGGTMMMTGDTQEITQLLREVDLVGNILRETNVMALNEQLEAIGQDPIRGFHHDMIRLPNGHTLTFAYVERMMADVQGVEGPVNVMADMLIDLDENWQVAWVWNSFDHLDIERRAVMNERCLSRIFCGPLINHPTANDWTHSNTIDYVPEDGSLMLSMRHQDWLLKINYADGAGDGSILWRLGAEGDFTAVSDDPWPWFSHQHQAHYISADRIIVYDNGNTRCATQPAPCHSRGQVWRLDETARTATLEFNEDLGLYSNAFGSASVLSNGSYHFTSANFDTRKSESLELKPNGDAVTNLETDAVIYRSFRVNSLYDSAAETYMRRAAQNDPVAGASLAERALYALYVPLAIGTP